jgi:hypothetical protein
MNIPEILEFQRETKWNIRLYIYSIVIHLGEALRYHTLRIHSSSHFVESSRSFNVMQGLECVNYLVFVFFAKAVLQNPICWWSMKYHCYDDTSKWISGTIFPHISHAQAQIFSL